MHTPSELPSDTASLPGTSFVPSPGSPFAVDTWYSCCTALHREARLGDLVLAEEILSSSA